MHILKSNFQSALSQVIRSNKEKEPKFTSTFTAGLEEALNASINDEFVEIKNDDYQTYVISHNGYPLVVIKAYSFFLPTQVLDWYAKEYDFERSKLTYSILQTVCCNKSSIPEKG